jgi:RsiW-degrading membrane proteinase PrsW (M82 family)
MENVTKTKMKKINLDTVLAGLLIGFLTPVIVYLIYYVLVYDSGLRKINISLCIAVNLVPFYIYQKKDKNKGLKGVFIATFILAGVVIFLSFFTNYFRIG